MNTNTNTLNTAQSNLLDQPGMAFEVELRNPNPSSRRTKDGPSYRLSFEVDESVHREFMHARAGNLRLAGWMVVLPDTDEEEAYEALRARAQQCAKEQAEEEQEDPETKARGRMWSSLVFKQRFDLCPGVREKLAGFDTTTTEKAHASLCELFGVEQLRDVTPEEAIKFFVNNKQAETMIRRAWANANAPRKSPDAAPIHQVEAPASPDAAPSFTQGFALGTALGIVAEKTNQ